MQRKSPLQKVSENAKEMSPQGIIALLLKDHKELKKLIKQIKAHRSETQTCYKLFDRLEKLTLSHAKAEETSLLNKIIDHPKFEDEALEGFEEHRLHEVCLKAIHKVRDPERKTMQMKIFCEFLEHHLKEEEGELFPRFKKYAALSTRKKMGAQFLKKRKATNKNRKKLGALKA